MNDYFLVSQVWIHEEPASRFDIDPSMRVIASLDHPGHLILQVRADGGVMSVRLSPDALRKLHQQAVTA